MLMLLPTVHRSWIVAVTEGLRGVQLGISDVTVLMATQDDDFRKPNTGMWTFFVESLNDGVAPGASPAFPTSLLSCAGSSPPRQPCQCTMAAPCTLLPEPMARVSADLAESFYAGDAAGRKFDFADSDKCAHCSTACKKVACQQSRPPLQDTSSCTAATMHTW